MKAVVQRITGTAYIALRCARCPQLLETVKLNEIDKNGDYAEAGMNRSCIGCGAKNQLPAHLKDVIDGFNVPLLHLRS